MTKPTIGELQAAIIKRTQDPLAAVKIERCASAIETLGALLSGITNKQAVNACSKALMDLWTDEELDLLSGKPEFVVALCAMLTESLARLINQSYDLENLVPRH